LKKKGFKEESMTKVRLYALGTSTTLESNKSERGYQILRRSRKRLIGSTALGECGEQDRFLQIRSDLPL